MALVDYFLKIETIDGESKDHKHTKEIELESWSWGATNTPSTPGGGTGSGKVSMQDMHFVMRVNKASPKLMLACAKGSHLTKAVMTCRKAGGDQEPYLSWTFTDVFISSYQTGGSGSSDVLPMDQVSLNFGKVEMEYKEQDEKGTLQGGIKTWYSQKTNQGG